MTAMDQGSAQQPDDRHHSPVPGLGNHGLLASSFSVRDNFDVSFQRTSTGVDGFTLSCKGGHILFDPMSKKEAEAIVLQLVSLRGSNTGQPEDPLPELDALRKVLQYAEEREIEFHSNLGNHTNEIVASVGERLLSNFTAEEIKQWISLNEVVDGVFHVRMPTSFTLASTFVRFQEHYESPHFRNKVFTFAEFKDWYRQNTGDGEYNYYSSWGGFNIPDHITDAFSEGRFDPLAPQEQALLEIAERLPRPFYLIGTSGRFDEETLRHETAHGMFHVDPEYREAALEIVRSIDTTPVREMLLRIGYCDAVLDDECHAYIGDPLEGLKEQGVTDTRAYRKAHQQLKDLYQEYFKKHEK
jgi:hypothetical protein